MDITQKHSNPEAMQGISSHDHALYHLTTDVGLKEAFKNKLAKALNPVNNYKT
jgi:hypothetical protein